MIWLVPVAAALTGYGLWSVYGAKPKAKASAPTSVTPTTLSKANQLISSSTNVATLQALSLALDGVGARELAQAARNKIVLLQHPPVQVAPGVVNMPELTITAGGHRRGRF